MKLTWVLVNCNTIQEADKIGQDLLKKRLIACFDIIKREKACYFWPPKTGRIETSKGCILIMETLPKYFKTIEKTAKKLHSDKLPFIGSLAIDNIRPDYLKWLKAELK